MSFDKKNPYFQEDGVPKTRKSVVVFADILGFTNEMIKAYDENRADKLLTKLHSALNDSYKLLKYKVDKEDMWLFQKLWATKTFTDNIVIGLPISENVEDDMEEVFFHVGLLQHSMTMAGFFIRGAIAIGDLYIDDDIVFGGGLIEAYRAENQLARDPRIILAPSAIDYNNLHISDYLEIEYSPQYRVLLRDVDGQIFLNYLENILPQGHESGPFHEGLLEHKEIVEKKLENFSNDPIIWNKYAWVANYHNYFCGQYGYLHESYKIDHEKFRKNPTRITKLIN